ncbi:hypothetical protein EIP91_006951 [Steccherinum ochraceum]|uniref:F-box domain-containing protein n=1 Tax=Steccherinum ochraceum TaxID=92696 RepID=A0A4V2MVK3_9APHY|nr:hypothetical protein EIP91_006951 [Steccherinum ochraceum]
MASDFLRSYVVEPLVGFTNIFRSGARSSGSRRTRRYPVVRSPSPTRPTRKLDDVWLKTHDFSDSLRMSDTDEIIDTGSSSRKRRWHEDRLKVLEEEKRELKRIKRVVSEAVQHALAKQEAKCNRHIFVNRVPKNILQDIFSLAVHSHHTPGSDTAVRIMKTCTYWKQIALESREMWSYLPLYRLTKAEAKLRASRSRGSALTIDVTHASKPANKVLWNREGSSAGARDEDQGRLRFCEKMLDGDRIRVLHVDLPRETNVAEWLTEDEGRQLSGAHLERRGSVPPPWLYTELRPDSRTLRILTLKQLYMPWNRIAKATSLTTFYMDLSGLRGRRILQHRDADILSVFRACTQLQELTLMFDREDELCGPLTPTHALIPLRKLRVLKLKLRSPDIAFILRSISIPMNMQTVHIVAILPKRPTKVQAIIQLPWDQRVFPCFNQISELEIDICKAYHEQTMVGSWGDSRIILTTVSIGRSFTQMRALAATFSFLVKRYSMPNLKVLKLADPSSRLNHDDVVSLVRRSSHLDTLSLTSCKPELLSGICSRELYTSIGFLPRLSKVELSSMTIPLATVEAFCQAYFGDESFTLHTDGRTGWTVGAEPNENVELEGRRARIRRRVYARTQVFVVAPPAPLPASASGSGPGQVQQEIAAAPEDVVDVSSSHEDSGVCSDDDGSLYYPSDSD